MEGLCFIYNYFIFAINFFARKVQKQYNQYQRKKLLYCFVLQ